MSPEEEPVGGRRLADTVARWATAAASVLAAALLAVISVNYGDLPREIRGVREQMAVLQVELRVVKEQQLDLLESNRLSQNWRERLVLVEQKADRNTDRLVDHEKRLDRIENPPSIFGGGRKKSLEGNP